MNMANNDLWGFGLRPGEARVNVTYNGQNGDLVAPVPFDATDAALREWVVEALGGGDVAGVRAAQGVDGEAFVVDRFPASEAVPYNRIFLRPKTPFG